MTTKSSEKLIGISISESPDLATLGYGEEHLHELMIGIARTVLRLGNSRYTTTLAYGGDLRPNAFTWALYSLARGEERERDDEAEPFHRRRLYSYMAWPGYLRLSKAEEAELINVCHFLRATPADAGFAQIKPDQRPDDPSLKEAKYIGSRCLTRMRERTTAGGGPLLEGGTAPGLAARIILGGKLSGYSSVMPGLFEEFLIAHERQVPIYLLGGFGGAGAVLKEAVLAPDRIDALEELTLAWHRKHTKQLDALISQFAAHPEVEQPQATYDRLQDTLTAFAKELEGDRDQRLSNGLTPAENRALGETGDEREIRHLLTKGLEWVLGHPASDAPAAG